MQPVFLPPADARAAFEKRRGRRLGDLGSVLRRRREAARRAHPRRRHAAWSRTTSSTWPRAAMPRSTRRSIQAIVEELAQARRLGREEPARRWPRCSRRRSACPSRSPKSRRRASPTASSRSSPAVAAEQQKIADAFFELKLIPKPIRISDALPRQDGGREVSRTTRRHGRLSRRSVARRCARRRRCGWAAGSARSPRRVGRRPASCASASRRAPSTSSS